MAVDIKLKSLCQEDGANRFRTISLCFMYFDPGTESFLNGHEVVHHEVIDWIDTLLQRRGPRGVLLSLIIYTANLSNLA
jgi:hypothetical protein